jgi:hypothetical protein
MIPENVAAVVARFENPLRSQIAVRNVLINAAGLSKETATVFVTAIGEVALHLVVHNVLTDAGVLFSATNAPGRQEEPCRQIFLQMNADATHLSLLDWGLGPYLMESAIDAGREARRDSYYEKRSALKELITGLTKEPFSWSPVDGELVRPETSRTAQRFLEVLPPDRELPRVAPDGDGGLYMAWGKPGQPTVVVGIVDNAVYGVVAPGTPQSRHIPEQEFDGENVPPEILSAIPKRS